MQRFVIYVDDADHARQRLEPWLAGLASEPVECIVVLSAPRITHRIGKWVAHASRQHWRQRWADRQRQRLEPGFMAHRHCQVEWHAADRPLGEVTDALRQRFGPALEVLDLRRPRHAPVVDERETPGLGRHWPSAVVAMSSGLPLFLALAD